MMTCCCLPILQDCSFFIQRCTHSAVWFGWRPMSQASLIGWMSVQICPDGLIFCSYWCCPPGNPTKVHRDQSVCLCSPCWVQRGCLSGNGFIVTWLIFAECFELFVAVVTSTQTCTHTCTHPTHTCTQTHIQSSWHQWSVWTLLYSVLHHSGVFAG